MLKFNDKQYKEASLKKSNLLNKMKNIRRFVAFGMIAFSAILSAYVLNYWHNISQSRTRNQAAYIFMVKSGDTLSSMANQLFCSDIIENPKFFYLMMRLKGVQLKVGEYEIPRQALLKDVVQRFLDPKPVIHFFTVIEGSTPQKTIDDMNGLFRLKGSVIETKDAVLAQTYDYTYGVSRQAFYTRLRNKLVQTAAELYNASLVKDVIASPEDMITLASIIEKESALPEERPRIAGVFVNRLRRGMPLQADCTVSYGLHLKNNRPLNQALTRQELQEDTPYNTYTRKGLPPAPICNPSLESLRSAAHPLHTDDLYYVANGEGGHIFAKNAASHRLNHQKWRRIRKKKQKEREVPHSQETLVKRSKIKNK